MKNESLGEFGRRMFLEGVKAGFSMTKDGFNAEMGSDDALMPSEHERARMDPIDWTKMPAAWQLARELAHAYLTEMPCPARNSGTHDDPDNSGGCIYCGLDIDFPEPEP